MKLLAAIAIAAAALVLIATASTAGAAQGAPPHLLRFLRHTTHASPFATARPTQTQHAAGINCLSSCSSYASTINQYFTDVAADNGTTTNVYSVATQYSSIQYNETFGGSYVDGNPFPTKPAYLNCEDFVDKYCVTDAQLQDEIAKVIAKNSWPTGSQTDLYFIFLPANVGVCEYFGLPDEHSNPCTSNVFCAYHSKRDSSFIYAVEPDAAAVAQGACDIGETPAGNGADDTISTISHEQSEAITDPLFDAWVANDGPPAIPGGPPTPQDEIGDLCAYDFGTTLGTPGTEYNQVINSHNYLLQLEYSNQDGGCVPYLGGPVTPPNPNIVPGTGPLVAQSATPTVMTTNTVYAIYWLPALPVNKALPAISGIAKVGKKLTASHGSWSGSPKYAYRWLRCSKTGSACKGISKATRSTYTLTKTDKGHRLEVRVTATNQAGRKSATSAPSRPVKS